MVATSPNSDLALPTGKAYRDIVIDGSTVQLGDVIHAPYDPEQKRRDEKAAILRDLSYDGMDTRRRHLDRDNLPLDSMDWVWTTDFSPWLQSTTEPIFWISGKPASGKSTLMHFLTQHKRTRSILRKQPGEWEILHFFFDFRAGKTLANTPVGMVKAFLHQLVQNLPHDSETTSALFIKQQENALQRLELDELIAILVKLVLSNSKKLCIFVDGLDEFEGDSASLLHSLDKIVQRTEIKLCIASRKLSPFTDWFQEIPQIAMQDHNRSSILRYIKHAMVSVYRRVVNLDEMFDKKLREEIVVRAEGVILWARLATDELLKAAIDGADAPALKQCLDGLPPELESLYFHSLERISPEHKPECAVVLRIVLDCQHTEPTTDLLLFIARLLSPTNEELSNLALCSQASVSGRLSRLLSPLIEIVGGRQDSQQIVRLMHKTLATYLHRTDWFKNNMTQNLDTHFPDGLWTRFYKIFTDHVTVGKDGITILALKALTPAQRRMFLPDAQATLPTLEMFLNRSRMGSIRLLELEACLLRSDAVTMILHEKTDIPLERFRHIWPGYVTPVLQPALRDLTHAIVTGQTKYFENRVRNATDLDTNSKSKLLEFALVHRFNPYPHPDLRRNIIDTASFLTDENFSLGGSHVCLLMHMFDKVRREKAEYFTSLERLIPAGATLQLSTSHHQECVFDARHQSLLHEWAMLSTATFIVTVIRNSDANAALEFLFNACQRFCNKESTFEILQKMLAGSPTHAADEDMFFRVKFAILVKNGLKPTNTKQSTDVIEMVRRFKSEMAHSQIVKSQKRTVLARRNAAELGMIIKTLQEYERTVSWNADEIVDYFSDTRMPAFQDAAGARISAHSSRMLDDAGAQVTADALRMFDMI